jgi:hypothetical protein
MRLLNRAHTARPWRIHELTPDFRLEDVWALPTPGGPDDFPLLVEAIAAGDTSESPSRAARALWDIRWKLGELLGWDDPDTGIGSRVPTLRDRLPADLREAPSGPDFDTLPFTPLYLLDDEFAAETANRTMHGVLHLAWVPDGSGGYRGQMAVLVKPNGLFGNAYMAAIRPFRHLIVYPPVMRQIEREWQVRTTVAAMHPFRAAIEARDLDAVRSLLSEDVVFRSPIVFKPYRGRDTVGAILEAASQVFEDFSYTREIGAPDAPDHALVFQARIGDKQVEGCDFLHVDESGAIDELVVMVRPLSGALALAEAMKARLAAAEAG